MNQQREIKFRAWNTRTKKLMDDVYPHGEYVCEPFSVPIPTEKQTAFSGDKEHGYWEPGVCYLMQYTGLKDKNGVEIYEGDVVRCKLTIVDHWVGEIVYDDSCGNYDLKEHSDRRNNELPLYNFDDLEVIGNIHQNPELLEGK